MTPHASHAGGRFASANKWAVCGQFMDYVLNYPWVTSGYPKVELAARIVGVADRVLTNVPVLGNPNACYAVVFQPGGLVFGPQTLGKVDPTKNFPYGWTVTPA